MAGIRGGKVKSIKALKTSLKKGSSGSYLARVGEDGRIVRFMTEPDEFIEYFEYYDETENSYFPEVEGVTPNLREGQRSSKRFLASAVDVSEGKVIPLVLPATVMTSLLKKYDKYATLTDRDYEITKEGTGKQTVYDVTPEPPTRMKMDRYEEIDLMKMLEAQIPGGDIEDEDGDDEDEAPRKSSRGGGGRKRPKPPVDDDDDDDDEDDEDEAPVRRKKPVAKASPKKRPARKRI